MRDYGRFVLGKLGLASVFALFAGVSHAALYDVNLGTGGTGSGTGQMTWTVGTVGSDVYKLAATAYSTNNNGTYGTPSTYVYRTSEGAAYDAGYMNNSTNAGGIWTTAKVVQYSGSGLGISNLKDESAGPGAPQHAMDNNGAIDIMVFSLLKNNVAVDFDPTTFKLSYTNNDSDVQAWIGGSTVAFNPADACLIGCASAKNITNAASGFTEITSTIAPDGGAAGTNIPVNTVENFNTTTTGKYLIMTGSLGTAGITGGNDFFKLSGLSVNHSIGTAPVPATVPLLLLGLIALGYARRRRSPRD